MKKLLIFGCIVLFIFCAPRKTAVKTEGLEEVVVFGEDTTKTVTEEPIMPPPTAEVTPPVAEEPVTPPPVAEEPVTPPPVITLPPTPEVAVVPLPPPETPSVPLVPTPPPTLTVTAPAGKIYGFRVQIFASTTEKNATRVADDARTTFTERLYVEFVAPYFKVRVGDCLTKEDAAVLKNKALKLGYKGAFIVETMINP